MINLMYHDIVTGADNKSGFQNENAFMYKVDEALFEEQVVALKECNVQFTFDDGGESFILKAAPILEKYGKKGIFFVSTNYIGTPGFLSEEQVKELHDRGHRIGSHSHTHPSNISLLNQEEIYEEWRESISILSRIIDETVTIASIPNGYASKSVVREAYRAGIKHLYTSTPTIKEKKIDDTIIQGRYVVHYSTGVDTILSIVSSTKKRFLLFLRWQLLETTKFILGGNYDKIKELIKKN